MLSSKRRSPTHMLLSLDVLFVVIQNMMKTFQHIFKDRTITLDQRTMVLEWKQTLQARLDALHALVEQTSRNAVGYVVIKIRMKWRFATRDIEQCESTAKFQL